MGFIFPGRRWQTPVVIALALAAAAVPSRAYDVERAAFVVAQTSGDELQEERQEDMQESPDYTAPDAAGDELQEERREDMQESPDYTAPDAAATAAAQNPTLAARRAEMIKDCEDNNGVDCAKQVDTELGAERLEEGGVQHVAPEHR